MLSLVQALPALRASFYSPNADKPEAALISSLQPPARSYSMALTGRRPSHLCQAGHSPSVPGYLENFHKWRLARRRRTTKKQSLRRSLCVLNWDGETMTQNWNAVTPSHPGRRPPHTHQPGSSLGLQQ